MTAKEVSAELGVSVWVVTHLCLDGRLPAIRRRTHWFIPANYQKMMDKRLLQSFAGLPNDIYKK